MPGNSQKNITSIDHLSPEKASSVYRAGFENIGVGMAFVDLKGRFITINQRLCEILGYTKDELISISLQELTLPEDLSERLAWFKDSLAGKTNKSFTRIKRYRHKSGHLVWAKLTATLIKNDDHKPNFFIFSLQDVIELKETEHALDLSLIKLRNAYKDLDRLSSIDRLTGAQKFSGLSKQIAFSLEQFKRHNTFSTLIFIDIDNLKEVNSQFGHATGDRVLRSVAGRLMEETRQNDAVARYDEDEFIVILPNTNFRQALDYYHRIGNEIQVNLGDGQFVDIKLSIGVSQITDEINTVDGWITQAKQLMQEQKEFKKPEY